MMERDIDVEGSHRRDGSLVLGAGGIGAEVARRMANAGPVAFTYARHEDRALALREELRAVGVTAEAIRCDARVESDLVAAFDAAENLMRIRWMVFCIGGWDYPRVTDLTRQSIDDSLALNLVSGLLALREAGRRVVDGGRVVLLSSAAAWVAPARQSTYAAAKAGLEVAARVAAKELAGRGITVNVVRPGATDTPTLHEGTTESAVSAMSKANAMKRIGTPSDIAGAVEALLADGSGWITGSIVDASGGLY